MHHVQEERKGRGTHLTGHTTLNLRGKTMTERVGEIYLILAVLVPLLTGFISAAFRLRDEKRTIYRESDDGGIYFTEPSNKTLGERLKSSSILVYSMYFILSSLNS